MATNDPQQDPQQPVIEAPEHSAAGGLAWKVMSAGATMLAASAADMIATKGWNMLTGRPVPKRSNWERTNTKDLVSYSAFSAALLTGAKVAAERAAAEYYRKSSNHLPKAIAEPKLTRAEKRAEKKARKAADKQLKRVARHSPGHTG